MEGHTEHNRAVRPLRPQLLAAHIEPGAVVSGDRPPPPLVARVRQRRDNTAEATPHMTSCSGDGSRFDPATQLRVCAGSGEGSAVRVVVYGAVDLQTAPRLRAALTSVVQADATGDVVVDLDGLTFGGAECVSTLLDARAALLRDGRGLRLINVPRFFKRVLAACRLEHLTG